MVLKTMVYYVESINKIENHIYFIFNNTDKWQLFSYN